MKKETIELIAVLLQVLGVYAVSRSYYYFWEYHGKFLSFIFPIIGAISLTLSWEFFKKSIILSLEEKK